MTDPEEDRLLDRIERILVNHVLKDGAIREAQEIRDARDRVREYKRWLKHRCKSNWKEKEENP